MIYNFCTLLQTFSDIITDIIDVLKSTFVTSKSCSAADNALSCPFSPLTISTYFVRKFLDKVLVKKLSITWGYESYLLYHRNPEYWQWSKKEHEYPPCNELLQFNLLARLVPPGTSPDVSPNIDSEYRGRGVEHRC